MTSFSQKAINLVPHTQGSLFSFWCILYPRFLTLQMSWTSRSHKIYMKQQKGRFGMRFRIVYILLLLPLRTVFGEGYPLHEQSFVVRLKDENFEHETQASTGGTTGSWLVWFHGHQDKTPIEGEVPASEFWSENHVVLATIDERKYPTTKRRFGLSEFPVFLFIHKGKYYRLDKDNGYNWEMIVDFVIEKYASTTPYDIPPPRTYQDDLKDLFRSMYHELVGKSFPYLIYFGALAGSLTMLNRFFPGPKLPLEEQAGGNGKEKTS